MKKIICQISVVLFLSLSVLACKSDDNALDVGPSISSFSPSYGPVGYEFLITGQNFGETITANTVKIGEKTMTITKATTTRLTVIVPEGAITGKISVTVNGKTDIGGVFSVTIIQ